MPQQQLTEAQRGIVLGLLNSGNTRNKVARIMGVNWHTIDELAKKWKETGSTVNRPKFGRPPIITPLQRRDIGILGKRDRWKSAREIQTELSIHNLSLRTIQQVLREQTGMVSYYSVKKPFISKDCAKNRLKWAAEHAGWSLDQWHHVLFSDESPFSYYCQSRSRVRRLPDERLKPELLRPVVKHPPKLNVWGCFAANGVGDICQVVGNMTAQIYVQILDQHLWPSAQKLFPEGQYIFQHDNDPKHTSRLVKDFLNTYDVNVLDWPSNSPDLNPIENLWAIIDTSVKGRRANSDDELMNLLTNTWKNIEVEKLAALVDSMPRRCDDVIRAKGYQINY